MFVQVTSKNSPESRGERDTLPSSGCCIDNCGFGRKPAECRQGFNQIDQIDHLLQSCRHRLKECSEHVDIDEIDDGRLSSAIHVCMEGSKRIIQGTSEGFIDTLATQVGSKNAKTKKITTKKNKENSFRNLQESNPCAPFLGARKSSKKWQKISTYRGWLRDSTDTKDLSFEVFIMYLMT